MLKALDDIIDRITMYRLLLYYLGALLVIALGLSIVGDLHYKPMYIVISTGVLLAACWATNKVFAYIFKAPTNYESSILTALILALIITPNPNPTQYNIALLLAVSGLAMASKYILTIRKKHIFNPAAVAVALMAIGPKQPASWWIGTAVMLPFVVIGGLIIIRKIRRFSMLISFLVSTTTATILYAVLAHASVATSLHIMAYSSSVFFLGFVMLTEPLTAPATVKKQVWYAALVGVLLPPQAHILSFYSSPEIALLIGNVFSYIVGPKAKLFPVLKQKIRIATNTADFVFATDRPLIYQAGQYMEFTLPHHKTDSRGNRRYFTLASSPTESDLRIGIKFYDNGSSYKKALLDMTQHTSVVAAQLAGEFVLPKDTSKKLVFIAGGIGITPFRSMVKYLMDTRGTRDVTLLYSVRAEADIAYKQIFDEATLTIGLRALYTITDAGTMPNEPDMISGQISGALIKEMVPDYAERLFYISGTHAMVEAMQADLAELGVHHSHVKTDFFPGYA